MTTPSVDAAVRALLEAHDFLELATTDDGDVQRVRVRCALTQHEMVPRADAIEAYLGSKKFAKARDWYCFDYSKYEPFIVAHRRKPKSLYCNVTGTVLNRIPAEVERHVNGKKFKRLKEHVTVSSGKGEEGGEKEGEFDANAFEFENSQVLYSDEEEEDDAPKKPKQQEEEDDMEDEEEEEEAEDDMDDLYPSEGDASEDERVHEEVQKALQAKDDAMGGDKPSKDSKQQPKKQPTKQPGKRTSHAKVVKKLRQQTKRMRVSSE